MKLNRVLSGSLLLSFACLLSAGESNCGCSDCETCEDGELKPCADSTHAVVCLDNKWVTVNCGASNMVCGSTSHTCVQGCVDSCACDGKLRSGGSVGDACYQPCYTETCINGGANALVCLDDVVTQLNCTSCLDAGYDSSKPLQVKCGGVDSCEGKLRSGGSVGDACDRKCYTQTCINGGANALVCWDDVVTQWDCANTCQDAGYDPSKPIQVKCEAACTASSTSGCAPACDPSGTKGYYWSNNDGLKTYECYSGKQCRINDQKNRVECYCPDGATCEGGGDACTASSTSVCAPACDPDGTKGYYWSNTTGLNTYDCYYGKTCRINDQNRVECYCPDGATCEGGGNNDLDDCTDSSDSKCAAACKADKSEGYYWNNSQSSLVKLTCTEEQECRLNGTSVNCIAKDLPATCSGSKCSELDGNAYFCDLESQSFYFVERQGKCSDSNACLICPDGFGGCGTDCSEGGHNELCTSPTKTENGNVNDCCDSLEYMPSCDGNVLNYCRSWGKVETKTCSSSCSVNTSTKKYTCK